MSEEIKETQPAEEKLSLGEKYFSGRMSQYGITDDINTVDLWKAVADHPGQLPENKLVPHKIFSAVEKGIKIIVYTLDRSLKQYKPNEQRTSDGKDIEKRGWSKEYAIIRLHTPVIDTKGKDRKYDIPKDAGTYPFFPPQLIDKYEKKERIKTLVLTEGYFKAFKAAMYGMDIIGLSSITHYKDKETGALHSDIIKLMKVCAVENIIWLADGDCNRISLKALAAGEDIYRRPNQFFSSCVNIRRMFDDYDVHKYFAHIDSINLDGMPKGLDDLLIRIPEKSEEIVGDLLSLSKPSHYFFREDMSVSTNRLRFYFCLHDVNKFVEFHDEQIKVMAEKSGGQEYKNVKFLKNSTFVWYGTKYEWDHEKATAKIVIPGDAKKFMRVGDDYHEKIPVPNKYGDLDQKIYPRRKSTITDDYGKEFVKHITKYKAFCNVPSHVNYQEVIHNCYNMYHPFEHTAEEGEGCEYTLKFLQHIFGEGTIKVKHPEKGTIEVKELDLGLDYIQLLYQRPQQILPILCLVSKENNTGKSTFGKWLRLIFTQNVAIVGNADLSNDFNGHWAGKLVVVIDEAKIDKQIVVEKIKALSTAESFFMNTKGKNQEEIEFFAKFIMNTNNEENFIYASEDDMRYWVRKVPVIQKLFVGMLNEMRDEIPAFLYFLDKRKMATENMNRAWFYPELIKTDALRKVIAFSQNTLEKELRERLREMFFDFGVPRILMTAEDILETFFKGKNIERNYLRRTVMDKMGIDLYHEWAYNGTEYKTLEEARAAFDEVNKDNNYLEKGHFMQVVQKRPKTHRFSFMRWIRALKDGKMVKEPEIVPGNGRPFVFLVDKFLHKDEIANVWADPAAKERSNLIIDSSAPESWGKTVEGVEGGKSGHGSQDELPLTELKDDLPF